MVTDEVDKWWPNEVDTMWPTEVDTWWPNEVDTMWPNEKDTNVVIQGESGFNRLSPNYAFLVKREGASQRRLCIFA